MAGRAGRRDRSDRCGCEWRSGRGARCDIPSTWPHPQRGTVFHAAPPPLDCSSAGGGAAHYASAREQEGTPASELRLGHRQTHGGLVSSTSYSGVRPASCTA
jgi:hypothetical protein